MTEEGTLSGIHGRYPGSPDPDAATTLAALVAYNGARFAGFARQPGIETVQGRIETALGTVFGREVITVGAGRTDAGVHARGQVVSFTVAQAVDDLARMRRSLDALVGDGIVVREIRRARPGFSARFDAVRREYRYRIVDGPVAPLFLDRFAWHVSRKLSVRSMQAAASALIGEHDFRSFCVAESAVGKSTTRTVERIDVAREQHLGEECIEVTVVGNAFLHSMVRTIVGSLVEVGAARRDAGWLAEALAARDRTAAGPTAPAHGLTFWHVTYPDEAWRIGE